MSDKAKTALEEWRTENSRRAFGGTFFLPATRAISVKNGMWLVQEYRPEVGKDGAIAKKGHNRIKKGKNARDHYDPWVTVSPPMTKDAVAARLHPFL